MIAAALAPDAEGEAVTLALLPELARLLRGTGESLSEYSLANLFLYAGRHGYRFHRWPAPHVRGTTYDGERHALPLTPLNGRTVEALLAEVDCIGPIGAAGPVLAAGFGLACDWVEADSDYVYDAPRLAELAGAKAKRMQARAFEAAERPVLVRIGPAERPLAMAVLDGWAADVARPPEETDIVECRAALAGMDALDLEGRLVLAGDQPVAFLLSGPAADGSRIVHFAKGRRTFAGAYPWMFAQFAAEVGTGRINFEQDLGKPGFAQAKRAFAPAATLPKCRLRRRNDERRR